MLECPGIKDEMKRELLSIKGAIQILVGKADSSMSEAVLRTRLEEYERQVGLLKEELAKAKERATELEERIAMPPPLSLAGSVGGAAIKPPSVVSGSKMSGTGRIAEMVREEVKRALSLHFRKNEKSGMPSRGSRRGSSCSKGEREEKAWPSLPGRDATAAGAGPSVG